MLNLLTEVTENAEQVTETTKTFADQWQTFVDTLNNNVGVVIAISVCALLIAGTVYALITNLKKKKKR